MDYINHESTGVKALRTAATIFVILGYLSAVAGLIMAFALMDQIIIFYPVLFGVAACGLCYLTASLLRAVATMTEAAQMYYWTTVYESEQAESASETSTSLSNE